MLKWLWGKQKKDAQNGMYKHGNNHLIELRNIIKTYETAAGKFTVLKGVDLQVDGGEFVAVIGKSGSGKSTLINMVTGIDRPTSGDVLVGDTMVNRLSESDMAVWRGKNLGIIFQFFQLLPTLSLVENVMLPMDFAGMYSTRERYERAMDLLDQVEMAENAHKLPSAVSGGQAQRVAIARALANDPPILIADEPTGSLDSRTASAVFTLFEKLVDQGKTIVMVTHDNDLARRASRAIIVVDGEVTDQHVTRALPGLTVDQMTRIARRLERRTYQPGETIVTQGDTSDRFFIITRGNAEVFLHHPDGQEIVVDRLGQSQYFGEIGLMEDTDRTATVRATADNAVEVSTISRDDFFELIEEDETTRRAFESLIQSRRARDTTTLSTNGSNGHPSSTSDTTTSADDDVLEQPVAATNAATLAEVNE